MRQDLKFFLNQFFSLEIVSGKRVRIPYWRNRLIGWRRIQGPFGGKGTPAQIKQATLKKAKQAKIDLRKMTVGEIRQFMRQKRIGLDCSGFAFQILDFLKPGFWRGLKKAPGRSRNPIRRFNAVALTAKVNADSIRKTADLRVGDLVPMSFKGRDTDHVAIIVDCRPKEIVYAHSSGRTAIRGPHLGKIRIVNPCLGLEEQQWKEFASNLPRRRGVIRMKAW